MVAIIAAIASYTHMRGLALSHGQDQVISTLLPLSVDGLMVVAAVAIGDGRRRTWSAWASFVTGVAASVTANVLAARPDPVSRVISAWPAIALLLVVEVMSDSTRGRRRETVAQDTTADTAAAMVSSADVPTADTTADTPGEADAAAPDGGTDAQQQDRTEDNERDMRTKAVADVLIYGATWDEAAAYAGVTVRTLKRWAGDAQREADERSRRARGARRAGQRAGDEPVSAPPADEDNNEGDADVSEDAPAEPINGAPVTHDVTPACWCGQPTTKGLLVCVQHDAELAAAFTTT